MLALQGEVAQAVAAEARLGLSPQSRTRLARPIDPRAHDAYLRGRYCWNKSTRSELERALHYFDAAIDIQPTFALAYDGLALTYCQLSSTFLPAAEAIPKARAAALRAIELDEGVAEPHATLAVIASGYDWNWPAAEKEFQRAFELFGPRPDPVAVAAGWAGSHGRAAARLGSRPFGTEEGLCKPTFATHLSKLPRVFSRVRRPQEDQPMGASLTPC